MARVHTAHGIGEIIQTETVRGRTSHLVEGAGFRAWVPATGCRTASDINESNSTTLPYDPTPQYPTDMWSNQATILPGDQEIDAEDRLSASDSLDFDSRREHTYPGPDPALFAGRTAMAWQDWADKVQHLDGGNTGIYYVNHGGPKSEDSQLAYTVGPDEIDVHGLYTHPEYRQDGVAESFLRRLHDDHPDLKINPGRMSPDGRAFHDKMLEKEPTAKELVTARLAALQVGPWTDEDWEDAENYDPTDEYRGHPDSWDHEPTEQDYADWEARHRRKGGLDEEDERGRTAAGRHRVEDFRGPISPGDDAGIARNPYTGDTETGRFVGNPEGRGHWDRKDRTRFDDEGDWFSRHLPGYSSLVDAGSTRESNLDPKYATWMLSAARTADDDSISRFRRDPIGEINRLGGIWSATSADDTIEEYGRLIQADRMLRESAWADVRAKANRLRSQGRIHVQHRQAGNIYATVDGDHGTYTTLVSSNGPGQSVGSWVCSCPWGMWAWKRKVSFVGRFCSHGYGAYQELRAGAPRDTKGRFASVTDDFQQYINDFRGGHIDQDGADTFIGMPDNNLTDAEVADLYDYVESNHTERADRPFGDPPAFPDGPLRTSPATLTPDLFRVPAPDASFLVDVEEDERATTGPDTVMSDKDWKTAAYVDALGTPYGPRIRRTADETTGEVVEDDEKNGGTVAPAEAPAAVDTTQPTTPAPGAPPKEEEPAMRGSFDPSMVTSIVAPIAQGVGSIADSLTGGSLASGIGGAVGSMVSGIGSGLGGFFTAAVDDDDDSEPDYEAYRQELLSLPEDVRKAWLTRTHASRRIASTDDDTYGYPPTDAEIEHLRGITDDAPLGHMDSHNDDVREIIDALREDGADASQIVASLHDDEGPVPDYDDIRYHQHASGSGPNPKDWSTTSEDAIALFDADGSHTDEDVTDLGDDYIIQHNSKYPPQKKAWKDGDADDPRTEAGLPPRKKSDGDRNFSENMGGPHPEEAAEEWAEGWDEYSQPAKKAAGRDSDVVRRFHASGAAEAINGPTRSDDDIAVQARKFLAKTAGRVYSVAEQEELVRESHPKGARNLPTEDDLRGTHYVDSL